MANYVKLDNNTHADLRVAHTYGEAVGSQVNQVRVFITEFEDLQREYPIFFRKTGSGDYYAVSILGLDTNENLFLADTSWTGRYVPAAIRRGPFQIGVAKQQGQEESQFINIDLSDPRVGQDKGLSLFEPSGGLSPYLTQISKTLNQISIGIAREPEFFSELNRLSLIEPLTVKLTLSDEKGYTIPDIYGVSKDKLMQLEAEDLTRLHQSGLLTLCQWVISSQNNTNNLLERKLRLATLGAA